MKEHFSVRTPGEAADRAMHFCNFPSLQFVIGVSCPFRASPNWPPSSMSLLTETPD